MKKLCLTIVFILSLLGCNDRYDNNTEMATLNIINTKKVVDNTTVVTGRNSCSGATAIFTVPSGTDEWLNLQGKHFGGCMNDGDYPSYDGLLIIEVVDGDGYLKKNEDLDNSITYKKLNFNVSDIFMSGGSLSRGTYRFLKVIATTDTRIKVTLHTTAGCVNSWGNDPTDWECTTNGDGALSKTDLDIIIGKSKYNIVHEVHMKGTGGTSGP